MILLEDEQNITIKVRELKEKPGKEIILVFGNYEILLDNRCLGQNTNVCENCKLKFRCYTSDALRINFDKEIIKMPLSSERPTIGEIIQTYLLRNGVALNLTKIVIDNEENI